MTAAAATSTWRLVSGGAGLYPTRTMSEIEIPEDLKDDAEKRIGLTIAIVAILLAVVSSLGKDEDNEKIVAEVKAASLEVKASNGFAWYQSKRNRQGMNDLFIEQMRIEALGNATPAQTAAMKEAEKRLVAKNTEYKDENEKILKEAEEFRKESVKEQAGAHHSAKAGDRYNKAEIFLQVGVVFCSITLLTKKRGFFYTGIGLAVVGVVIGVSAFVI
jgi:regulator of replication initiation timing